MLTTTEIAGFVGAGLAGAAYVPQISHLIRARCSAGISRLAFAIWLLASFLTTARAIDIHDGVFIVLGGIQIVATTLIMFYAARYKDTRCPIHPLANPGPRQLRHMRQRAWLLSVRPAALSAESATPVEHGGGTARVTPVLHRRTYAITARSGREPDVQVFRS